MLTIYIFWFENVSSVHNLDLPHDNIDQELYIGLMLVNKPRKVENISIFRGTLRKVIALDTA